MYSVVVPYFPSPKDLHPRSLGLLMEILSLPLMPELLECSWSDPHHLLSTLLSKSSQTNPSTRMLSLTGSDLCVKDPTSKFPPSNKVDRSNTWKPPPHGQLKLNVDVAHSTTLHRMGFGVVIQNSEGGVVAAISSLFV
ncbi:uncharacterized protein LOC133818245 isoform X1 [Humulus lupulus]|uniref:uncharacterized protein LOC133818245 isoform X1 n=1 Tax=Humulus lupulus TaxID=3486 RepID=UPI002B408DF0|nr:uncharacterized protein LOC133818245 isoform X1 [Humulus lupulus]